MLFDQAHHFSRNCVTRGIIERLGCAAITLAVLIFMSTTASAQTVSPPFRQCPAIGAATSCTVLIVFNANGSVSIFSDPTQDYWDGEDTLIGVQNNSTQTIPSVTLQGPALFDFDDDGICYEEVIPRPAGCPF